MKPFALAAAAAAALSMCAASAQAAVFIGISTDGGATINQVFTTADGTFEFLTTNVGGFDTISVEGDASAIGSTLLHSDIVGVIAPGPGSVSIFVTRTDLAAPLPASYVSNFTSNNSSTVFSVTETTFVDVANGLWGGAQLATVTFTGQGAEAANFGSPGVAGAGPFSVTHRYDIVATGAGSTSPTIILSGTAIPEPTAWALMIMGFGAAGAMMRRRRHQLAAA